MTRPSVLAMAVVLALAACGEGGESTGSPVTSAPVPVLPLTGLAPTAGLPNRAVLVVKVDNTAAAQPQVGLSAADLVVEELVEGGLTRLAVMYHSALPDAVAPVRSVRTSDIGVVVPTGGALIGSGGAARVMREVRDAGLVVVTESAPGFTRDPSRHRPYNLVVAPAETLAVLTDLGPPSHPYLPWSADDEPPSPGAAASAVSLRFSAAHTTDWEWTGDAWSRADELAAEGDEFRPDNVLVLRVAIRDAGYTDPAGNPVPETVLEGSGEAILLSGGRLAEARWTKADASAPIVLADPSGADMPVPPGKTWIELLPEQGDVTVR